MIKVEIVEAESTKEAVVDEDLRRFDEWFQGLGNDPLIGPEKAIIKTFLFYKLGLEKKT